MARSSAPARVDPQPTLVDAVPAVVKDVPVYVSALGTVVARQTVTIRTQVDGRIDAVRFKEGQHVRVGDILVEIDARSLRAKLKQSTGQLKRDEAVLVSAKRELARYKEAFGTGTVTQQTVDNQAAAVDQAKGAVLADQGAIDEAGVELGYCTIRSPIDGIVGLRQVDAGNFVRASDANGIVTIVAHTPITVVFAVQQSDIGRVVKAQQRDKNGVSVAALDEDNRTVLARGSLDAIDNVVDPSTGTIKLKAVFDNAKGTLFPGQFVNARMRIGTLKRAAVVPSHAVLHGAKGDYVFIVQPDRTVKRVAVKSGPENHGETPLLGGDVKAGDAVVTDGAARLSDHTSVVAHVVAPAPARSETPAGVASGAASGAAARTTPDAAAHASSAPQASGGKGAGDKPDGDDADSGGASP